MKQLRVLVVDDSALMRKLIPQLIERDPSIQVVGTAMDGEFALKKIADLKPDVVTLDLEMPRMDGMEMLKQLMRVRHVPVIVVSAHSTEGASATFKALNLGAVDFITKPKDALSESMEHVARDLIAKIKAAGQTKLGALPVTNTFTPRKKVGPVERGLATHVIAIGISTGGPNSLQYMLSQLPADFSASIVVVQHMPEGFTDMFARRLNEVCAIDVKEAQSGDLLLAGRALICPGNRHVRIRRMPKAGVALLNEEERVNGHRPSADVLFKSAAADFGPDATGIIMTGMGDDGAEGLGAMRRAGSLTIAQDEASSVVFGMPRAAIERGYATRVVPLDAMANTLMNSLRGERTAPVVGRM